MHFHFICLITVSHAMKNLSQKEDYVAFHDNSWITVLFWSWIQSEPILLSYSSYLTFTHLLEKKRNLVICWI